MRAVWRCSTLVSPVYGIAGNECYWRSTVMSRRQEANTLSLVMSHDDTRWLLRAENESYEDVVTGWPALAEITRRIVVGGQ